MIPFRRFLAVAALLVLLWPTSVPAQQMAKEQGDLQGNSEFTGKIQSAAGKSIEGAVGGLVIGAALGWIGAVTFAGFLHPWAGLASGLGIAAAAQIGDMVESLLKRDTARKDSAVTMNIPGHGGVLDRFDSILFAAPPFYYVLKAVYL